MPVIRAEEAVLHELHGSRFSSYLCPARGSSQLSAWRLDVSPGTEGVPHRLNRDEILLVLAGELQVQLEGIEHRVRAGDVLLVPVGVEFAAGAGPDGATAWVTTSAGLQARLADGSVLTPPWAA